MDKKYIINFWEKVNKKDGGCWVWRGATNKKGYGVAWDGHRTQKAHRISYMLTYGYMPELCVLHKCDVPNCVNPNHLFLGTRADNNNDMRKKGRNKNACTHIDKKDGKYKRGENHHNVKLTPEIVTAIRKDYQSGNYSYSKLSKKYNISIGHSWRVVNKKVWTHVA